MGSASQPRRRDIIPLDSRVEIEVCGFITGERERML